MVITRRPPRGSIAEQFFINIPGASKCSITSPPMITSKFFDGALRDIGAYHLKAAFPQFRDVLV